MRSNRAARPAAVPGSAPLRHRKRPARLSLETASATACAGDCDNSGGVTIDEILTLVNIALGNADVSGCEPGDRNGDGKITIDEILAAVNNALNGCE